MIAFWTIFIFFIVVFIHELGHFFAARACGIKVKGFSVGFGKKIWSIKDSHGTEWMICILPLGGFVSFDEDVNKRKEKSDQSEEIKNKKAAITKNDQESLNYSIQHRDTNGEKITASGDKFLEDVSWKVRAWVAFAGPLANYLLSFIGIFLIMIIFGRMVISPQITAVSPGSPAFHAGLAAGDIVEAFNGKSDFSVEEIIIESRLKGELNLRVRSAGGKTRDMILVANNNGNEKSSDAINHNGIILDSNNQNSSNGNFGGNGTETENEKDTIGVINKGKIIEEKYSSSGVNIVNRMDVADKNGEEKYGKEVAEEGEKKPLLIGLHFGNISFEKVSAGQAAIFSFRWIINMTLQMIKGLYAIITGAQVAQISGPIKIIQMSAESAASGVKNVIMFIIVLSINLGFINLLPIPGLDGGHIVLNFMEGIYGRPLNDRVKNAINLLGYAILLSLMVFAISSDVISLLK